MSDLINHKAVYRTAPATPGLLKNLDFFLGFSFSLALIV